MYFLVEFAAPPAAAFDVAVQVDASKTIGPLKPIWRFFGCDEPNYVYMKDGERLVGQLGEMRKGEVFFRAHNLLTSGDGTPALKWGSTNAYTLDADGNPVYNWTIVDYHIDALIERGVRPYVEIGFMPEALSIKPEPYRHEWRPGLPYNRIMTGWRFPPKSYEAWQELVYQMAKHCVDRYGMDEVKTWYWETWNEANILPHGYWGGSREEFLELHDHAIAGVKRAIPDAKVGGPDSAGDGGISLGRFSNTVCAAKTTLRASRAHRSTLSLFTPRARRGMSTGTFVWESPISFAPSIAGLALWRRFLSCSTRRSLSVSPTREGCAACQGPMFSYRNGTVYSSYTAASFARKHELADKHGVNFEGALTWAFEFEDQPYFAGFRQLATNGVPLPVLNIFRMFSKMSGERLASESSSQMSLEAIMKDGVRGEPDVGVLAARDGEQISLMVWHYHDDDVAGPAAEVKLSLDNVGAEFQSVKLTHYRVDGDNSNSYAKWQSMGSPNAPNEKQYDELLQSAELATIDQRAATYADGSLSLEFQLPRQGVSLLLIDAAAE